MLLCVRRGARVQRLQQPLGQPGSVKNRSQQQETAARVFFARSLDQNFADFRIAGETLRTLQQPDIELAFRGAQVGYQLGVVALRVIHQETRDEP